MYPNLISAEIVADSKAPTGERITTYKLVMPRFILAEFNTHRLFSRNSASSRAIPLKKMIQQVKKTPFIPMAFQKDHSGMQGVEYITDEDALEAVKYLWLEGRNVMIRVAESLNAGENSSGKTDNKVTKQLCNRLLEPFLYHTVLVTATEWSNFFALRNPDYVLHDDNKEFHFKSRKDAIAHFGEDELVEYQTESVKLKDLSDVQWLQFNEGMGEIHIMDLAEKMWDAMNESTPKELKEGEWHIPFGDNIDLKANFNPSDKDKEFHSKRRMFIVKEDKLQYAPVGCDKSHIEYFGDLSNLVRGFIFDNKVYTYINDFIPIRSNIVRNELSGMGYSFFEGTKDGFHYNYDEKIDPQVKIATARCARISYETLGDNPKIDYEADIKLHDMLLKDGHMSPMEHCARVMTYHERKLQIKGEGKTYSEAGAGAFTNNPLGALSVHEIPESAQGWSRNFKGFIQYRELVEQL